jgi:uroporphyrinogen decarboxylase
MTSLERISTTLSHREPDRVPYDLAGTTVTSISPVAYRRAMAFKGLSPDYDERRTIDPISQVIVPPDAALQLLKVDTRRLGAPRILHWGQRVNVEGPLARVTDQYGCQWLMDCRKDFYFNLMSSPLSQGSDLKDVLAGYRMPNLSKEREWLFALLDEQSRLPGPCAWVADRCCAGLLEMCLRFRGFENFYMDLALDPESSRRMFDMIADHKIEYWGLIAEYIEARGLQHSTVVVSECDDLGAQESLLVSPEMLRSLVFPPMRRHLAFIKKRMPWVKIFFHSCGAVREVLSDFIEMGVDILNPVQYTAAGMDLSNLKKDFGKDLVFWGGGVDTQGILSKGTPRQVADEVKRTMDILAPGGGFVFTPVHNVQEDVPPGNFWAMWEAWERYGIY